MNCDRVQLGLISPLSKLGSCASTTLFCERWLARCAAEENETSEVWTGRWSGRSPFPAIPAMLPPSR